jgi:choline dehydrogenase-like flavoprotein
MKEAYPVLKRDYPLNEMNLDWWASDEDSPYTEIKRFDWFRGYQVGGRSLMWGRQSYRWSDFDFEANARDGSPSISQSGTRTGAGDHTGGTPGFRLA